MSNSSYATITFLRSNDDRFRGPQGAEIIAPIGGQIDIQVGIFKETVETYGDAHVQFGWGYRYVYTQLGDWSNIQTLTGGQPAVTPIVSPTQPPPTDSPYNPTVTTPPTQNPTVTPLPPDTQTGAMLGLDWEKVAIVVLCVFVGVLLVLVAVLFHKVSKKSG